MPTSDSIVATPSDSRTGFDCGICNRWHKCHCNRLMSYCEVEVTEDEIADKLRAMTEMVRDTRSVAEANNLGRMMHGLLSDLRALGDTRGIDAMDEGTTS